MDKRFQVFVSSTYEDLREERQEVMHALLELDCIPSGMELFSAANEDQWSLIKKVIDESDYYLLISAGRYGSIGQNGHSYTEMEYRYALESGKPVVAFLHKDIQKIASARCEPTDDGKKKLADFRDLVQRKMCKFWETPSELGSVVSRSLIRLTKTNPAIGWIRADQITDASSAPEILKLRNTIESLEAKLREARLSAPVGTEKLSQGDDIFSIDYTFDSVDKEGQSWSWNQNFDISWNTILYDIGPLMLDEATDREIHTGLNKMVRERSRPSRKKNSDLLGHSSLRSFAISEHDLQTIKIQLRALGIIAKSERTRSVKDNASYWALTPYGDQLLTTIRAIQKEQSEPEDYIETDESITAEES